MPDAECRVQTSPGSAAGDPPQLKPNSATLCPREHKSEFWKETDGTKTRLLLGEEAGVITDLRLDLLHCFDFYLTWFTFFSTIDKKAVLLGSSGLRHGDSQRRSGDQGAGRWCLLRQCPAPASALPRWQSLSLPGGGYCQFADLTMETCILQMRGSTAGRWYF